MSQQQHQQQHLIQDVSSSNGSVINPESARRGSLLVVCVSRLPSVKIIENSLTDCDPWTCLCRPICNWKNSVSQNHQANIRLTHATNSINGHRRRSATIHTCVSQRKSACQRPTQRDYDREQPASTCWHRLPQPCANDFTRTTLTVQPQMTTRSSTIAEGPLVSGFYLFIYFKNK